MKIVSFTYCGGAIADHVFWTISTLHPQDTKMLLQQAGGGLSCRSQTHLAAPHVTKRLHRPFRAVPVPPPPAAAAGANPGALPASLCDALERYGHHAKAAYILFGKFEDGQGQPVIIKGNDMEDYSKDVVGYKGVANMLGDIGLGNVLSKPVQVNSVDDALLGEAAEPKPSFLGYVCEGKQLATQNGGDVQQPPELVIAFRGTSVNADWVNNLLGGVAAKKAYKRGRVHQGFHNMLYINTTDATPIEVIEEAMNEYHQKHHQHPPRVITTGHSLGGALATIAAAHIAIKYDQYQLDAAAANTDYTQRPLQTYTFAAPRVGDDELYNYFSETLGFAAVQMKNLRDPVPDFCPGPGEAKAAFRKVWALIEANIALRRTSGSTTGGLLAPSAAGEITALDNAGLKRRLEVYDEVLKKCADEKQLSVYVEKLEQQYNMSEPEIYNMSEPEELTPTAALSLGEKIMYAKDLLETFSTKWSNNPAPPIGVFTSDESGDWGGPFHSLQVYMNHIQDLRMQ